MDNVKDNAKREDNTSSGGFCRGLGGSNGGFCCGSGERLGGGLSGKYPLTGRENHPENTVVKVGNATIGDGKLDFIAGPCAVESEKQIIETATALKKSGVKILRGGAYKPRTSPYSFQGLGKEGLKFLRKAKEETGLAVVTEITDLRTLDLFDGVDMIQIGARNMQNFELLKEVGKFGKPVLLKRGFVNTVEEWLMSAEYIASNGALDIVLCERGVRTFETLTRNTLDLGIIPLVKELTRLPVIIDPSHASGNKKLIRPLTLAAAAVGADGAIIECCVSPENAVCDGEQAITPEELKEIISAAAEVRKAAARVIEAAEKKGETSR